jgi:hypothetical protein
LLYCALTAYVVWWLTAPPATEVIGATGREIESLQGVGW